MLWLSTRNNQPVGEAACRLGKNIFTDYTSDLEFNIKSRYRTAKKTNTKRPTSSSQQMGWWPEQGSLCFLHLRYSQPSHIFLGLVSRLPCILCHCGLEPFEAVSRAGLLTLTLFLPCAVTLVTEVTKTAHYCREAVWAVCASACCLLVTSENASSM